MSWIQTYSGNKVYPFSLRSGDVNICDIAHALSNICRYNGHCNVRLSVAEHSVNVCKQIPDSCSRDVKLWALLHDASEAYLGDAVRPLKRALLVAIEGKTRSFSEVEHAVQRVIAERFGLLAVGLESPLYSTVIKYADDQMLATEARKLMKPPPEPWESLPPPITDLRLNCYGPEVAKQEFLLMFNTLCRPEDRVEGY